MPEHLSPEPLMPLLIAAKPGGKAREVLVDEATGERLMRDLVVALAGIRAAKAAVLAMTAPGPWDPSPYPHAEDEPVDPGDVIVDATIHEEWCPGVHADALPCPPNYCGQRYFDGDDWQECAEPAGHDGLHGDQPPDAAQVAGAYNAAIFAEPCQDCGQPMGDHGTDEGGFKACPDAERAADEVYVAPAGDGPCMTAGCGHGAGDHVQSRGTGERMFCVTCPCRRYLGLRRIVDVDGEIAVDGHDPGGVTYTNVNHLSCGCSFLGPLTWPAGKQARCDDHGPVTTVDGEPDEPMPDCTRPGCGHGERAHAADDEENADGPCLLGGCRCAAYLLPPVTVAAALAPVSFLRHDQQTLAGVRIGGTS